MSLRTRLAALTLAAAVPAVLPGAALASDAPVAVRAIRGAGGAGDRTVAGTVVSAKRATLSTRIAASVRAVLVEEGQRVAAGQLLVSLADEDLRGGQAAAEAGLAAAAAHERRIRQLLSERAATTAELDQAVAQRAQAEAGLAGVRANLAYAQLRAPFAATVQARRVDPGDLVGPGQPLLELEGDGLEIQASLSDAEAAGLAVGSRLRFQAGGTEGEAEVVALTPGGDPVTHRRSVKARVRGAAAGLRSGAFARLLLPPAPAGAAAAAGPAGRWIPRTALVERGDLAGVFVAASGRAELRWVSTGEAAGDQVWVRAGLRAGEVVIDAPGALRDGAAVEVQP
jgi:RND family efflux transporter MFP subunit